MPTLKGLQGNRWATLAIVSIGFLMILIDTTIVNVSIPTIIKDLGASLADIEWIISGYALSFAALLITFGRLGDMYGRRNFFILGLLIFTVASLFSGEAGSPTSLITARLFQGVGGAVISPATLSLISSNFRGRERSLAFGIWGAIAGIAVAIGPILGGWLTTYYSWRWIFRVNVPVGLLGMLAAALFIRESKIEQRQRLDISGMLTSTIGFFFLVFGLIEGQTYGWWSQLRPFSLGSFTWDNSQLSIIPISFAISLVFLAAFAVIQYLKTKRGLQPAVNVDFFRSLAFRYGLIAIAVIALGEFSSLFTVPIFLQSVRGFTPLQSGYAVLPLAIGTFLAAPTSARLVNRIGSKWVITAGIFTEFVGLLLLSRLQADTQYTSLIAPFAILGVGIGLALAQNTQVTLSEIPPQESGSASGVLNTVRQVGTALGIALIGAVLSSQMQKNVADQINGIDQLPAQAKQQIIDAVTAGGVASAASSQPNFSGAPVPTVVQGNPVALQAYQQRQEQLTAQVKNGIDVALSNSIASAIRFGSLFVLIGAFLSLLIPNVRHREE